MTNILAVTMLVATFGAKQGYAQTGSAGVGNSAVNPLWLKADAGTSSTTSGTPISAWDDQSGNANNSTQATANKQPLFQSSVINGMPAVLFDNSSTANDELVIADNDNLDNTAGLTVFSVTRPFECRWRRKSYRL